MQMCIFILVVIYIISCELIFVTTQLISLIRKGTVFEVKKENLLQAYCRSNLQNLKRQRWTHPICRTPVVLTMNQ